MQFEEATDLKRLGRKIIKSLNFIYIDGSRVFYYRSFGSKSKSTARIWSLPRILQQALRLPAFYVIEFITPYFDKLTKNEQEKVLIHEFLHIPKNFGGSLLPHRGRNRNLATLANILFKQYKIGSS